MHQYCSLVTAIRRTCRGSALKMTPSFAQKGCQAGHAKDLTFWCICIYIGPWWHELIKKAFGRRRTLLWRFPCRGSFSWGRKARATRLNHRPVPTIDCDGCNIVAIVLGYCTTLPKLKIYVQFKSVISVKLPVLVQGAQTNYCRYHRDCHNT